jgi:phosphoserine phosphatase
MHNKKSLIIVSHFGAQPLGAALELIKKLDPDAIVREISRNLALHITHDLGETAQIAVFEKFDSLKLDYSTIAPAPKKLFVADMDSTIINCECLDELADFAGKKQEVSTITERAMAGELDFEAALKERVMMLKGLPVSNMLACYSERVKPNQGALELIQALKKNSVYCSLVSGGFKFFTSRIKELLGFDEDNSNQFIYDGNLLSGSVEEPILGKEAKLARLQSLCLEKGFELSDCIAIGDGANDLMMIEAAGLGIAYMAKPIVAARAPARINSGNLTSVLIFCGYEI